MNIVQTCLGTHFIKEQLTCGSLEMQQPSEQSDFNWHVAHIDSEEQSTIVVVAAVPSLLFFVCALEKLTVFVWEGHFLEGYQLSVHGFCRACTH